MTTLIYFILVTISTHYWFNLIFEFLLFTGKFKTHRFKERIYPKKYSYLKRLFMLTYFDEELREQCKYKEQMRKVIIADRVYLIWALVLIIIQIYALVVDKSYYWLDIGVKSFFVISVIFFIWFDIHSVRWKEWIKGKWSAGRIEFQIKLPDEKKKK